MNFIEFMFFAGISALCVICFVMCMVSFSKISSMEKSIEELDSVTKEVRSYYQKMKNIETQLAGTPALLPKSVFCKIAVVHFNAFDDVTGAVSFAMAMLDNNNNGVILTSIYGRENCNTYIREVKSGECEINLLEEERKALSDAVSQEVN